MSTSGLCRCGSRTHEVGPVPVFVSEENPGVLAFSLRSTPEERLANLFAQPFLLWEGSPAPPLHCKSGRMQTLTAVILTGKRGEQCQVVCV